MLPKDYEGWAEPKIGKSPFKILNDPAIIAKKNKIREALRDEYTRRVYNPYRQAANVSGMAFDPAFVRYNAMMRTRTQFYRPGPRVIAATIFGLILPYSLLWKLHLIKLNERSYIYRTGQVAYKDRREKRVF